MRGKGLADARVIDVSKSTRFVEENLENLVLHFLRGQAMSQHEIVQDILSRHGVSVSQRKMGMLLGSLKERGLVEERKRELLTTYALTDEGRKTAEQVRFDELKTLL